MMRARTPVTVAESWRPKDGGYTEKHPSFGMLQISHVSCGPPGQRLFGSDLQHAGYISLRICPGEAQIGETQHADYMARGVLIEVDLSHAQWAEAMSNMNTMGVPCTISYTTDASKVLGVEPGLVPEPLPTLREADRRREHIEQSTVALAAEIRALRKEIQGLLDEAKVPAKRQGPIVERIVSIERKIGDRLPYVASEMQETMEKIVASAKIEVEAYTNAMVHRVGLAALADGQGPTLLTGSAEIIDTKVTE